MALATDPWPFVIEDVTESVATAEACHAKVVSAGRTMTEESKAALSKLLAAVASDLEALDDALASIDANRRKCLVSDSELAERRAYLVATRARLAEMETTCNTAPVSPPSPSSPTTQRRDLGADQAELGAALLETVERWGDGASAQVQLLLSQGAPVDARSKHGGTALMIAAERGAVELVQLLVAAGAAVGASNKFGDTASSLAAAQRHTDVLSLLPGATHDFSQLNSSRVPCRICCREVGVGRVGLFCRRCSICSNCGLTHKCASSAGTLFKIPPPPQPSRPPPTSEPSPVALPVAQPSQPLLPLKIDVATATSTVAATLAVPSRSHQCSTTAAHHHHQSWPGAGKPLLGRKNDDASADDGEDDGCLARLLRRLCALQTLTTLLLGAIDDRGPLLLMAAFAPFLGVLSAAPQLRDSSGGGGGGGGGSGGGGSGSGRDGGRADPQGPGHEGLLVRACASLYLLLCASSFGLGVSELRECGDGCWGAIGQGSRRSSAGGVNASGGVPTADQILFVVVYLSWTLLAALGGAVVLAMLLQPPAHRCCPLVFPLSPSARKRRTGGGYGVGSFSAVTQYEPATTRQSWRQAVQRHCGDAGDDVAAGEASPVASQCGSPRGSQLRLQSSEQRRAAKAQQSPAMLAAARRSARALARDAKKKARKLAQSKGHAVGPPSISEGSETDDAPDGDTHGGACGAPVVPSGEQHSRSRTERHRPTCSVWRRSLGFVFGGGSGGVRVRGHTSTKVSPSDVGLGRGLLRAPSDASADDELAASDYSPVLVHRKSSPLLPSAIHSADHHRPQQLPAAVGGADCSSSEGAVSSSEGAGQRIDRQLERLKALLAAGQVMSANELARRVASPSRDSRAGAAAAAAAASAAADDTAAADAAKEDVAEAMETRRVLRTLRQRHLECLNAIEDLQLDLDGLSGWRHVRERHGWAISSRRAPDGHLLLTKSDGFCNGVSPLLLWMLFRQCRLWPIWMPHCDSASVLKQVSANEMVVHARYTLPWPMSLLLRADLLLHLYIVDLLDQRGCFLLIGRSISSYPGVQVPPPPRGTTRLRLEQLKAVAWPLGRTRLRVSLQTHTRYDDLGEGLAALLPKSALDYMTQSWHAEVLHQLVAQAAHVREAGEDSPFSRTMQRERQYYSELSKRIARYLNARE